MLNLTKSLSEEFGPSGVRVNSVSPGATMTPWWTDEGGAGDIIAGWTGSDGADVIATVAPELMQLTTGRFAEPQEIADAVVFLASPRAASTTGADMVVDSACSRRSDRTGGRARRPGRRRRLRVRGGQRERQRLGVAPVRSASVDAIDCLKFSATESL